MDPNAQNPVSPAVPTVDPNAGMQMPPPEPTMPTPPPAMPPEPVVPATPEPAPVCQSLKLRLYRLMEQEMRGQECLR